jgi:hypothetical protein
MVIFLGLNILLPKKSWGLIAQYPVLRCCCIEIWVSTCSSDVKVKGHYRYIPSVIHYIKGTGEAVLVTGRGGPYGCETSRLSHLLDNRLTDGGKVVSLTRRPPFTPQEDSWYSFLLEAESTPGP